MTYFILQTSAMFLVAYFAGCAFGCLFKTLLGAAPVDTAELIAGEMVPAVAPAPRRPDAAPTPAPVPAPVVTRASPAAQPVPRQAGSGVAAEVTAAAAAAAASTVASAMLRSPASTSTAAPVIAGDDLKRIKGIGPEIERRLNSLGVRRYAEIAGWSAADVGRFSREIGQDGRIQHENWIEQAQILSRGGETAFSRRVDRREVSAGTVDTWKPTAPNEVARQAAAAAPSASQPPPPIVTRAPTPPPPSPVQPMATTMASTAAAATTAAVVANRSAIPAAPAPPPAAQGISMRPAPGPGNLRRFVRLAAPEGKPDDLSLISGVGEKIGADLNRYGVYHYWQLAAMGPDDIDYMETRLGHKGRMRREEWPEQARELMSGKPPRARTDRDRTTQLPQDLASAHTSPAHKHVPPASQIQGQPAVQAPPAASVIAQPVSQSQSTPPAAHVHRHVPPVGPAPGQPPVQVQAAPAAQPVSGPAVPVSPPAPAARTITASVTSANPPPQPVGQPPQHRQAPVHHHVAPAAGATANPRSRGGSCSGSRGRSCDRHCGLYQSGQGCLAARSAPAGGGGSTVSGFGLNHGVATQPSAGSRRRQHRTVWLRLDPALASKQYRGPRQPRRSQAHQGRGRCHREEIGSDGHHQLYPDRSLEDARDRQGFKRPGFQGPHRARELGGTGADPGRRRPDRLFASHGSRRRKRAIIGGSLGRGLGSSRPAQQ